MMNIKIQNHSFFLPNREGNPLGDRLNVDLVSVSGCLTIRAWDGEMVIQLMSGGGYNGSAQLSIAVAKAGGGCTNEIVDIEAEFDPDTGAVDHDARGVFMDHMRDEIVQTIVTDRDMNRISEDDYRKLKDSLYFMFFEHA